MRRCSNSSLAEGREPGPGQVHRDYSIDPDSTGPDRDPTDRNQSCCKGAAFDTADASARIGA